MDIKEIKQRDFAESETKNFVISPDKNAENVTIRTRDEDLSNPGDIYNARNHYRGKGGGERDAQYGMLWMKDNKSVTGHSANDIKHLVQGTK